jgi:hypothetical protein
MKLPLLMEIDFSLENILSFVPILEIPSHSMLSSKGKELNSSSQILHTGSTMWHQKQDSMKVPKSTRI